MVVLILRRVEQLREHARAKIERLAVSPDRRNAARGEGGGGGGWEDGDATAKEEEEEEQRALTEMLISIRAPSKPIHASKPEEYSLKKTETFTSQVEKRNRPTNPIPAGGDTPMLDVGTNDGLTHPDVETEAQILKTLNADLLALVEHSVEEMVGYSEHARDVSAGYQRALERRVGNGSGSGSGSGSERSGGYGNGSGRGTGTRTGAGGGGGILRNGHQASPVDKEMLRRMSGGDL